MAGSSATEKAVQARKYGKHVVTPDWLRACMFRWVGVREFACWSEQGVLHSRNLALCFYLLLGVE